MDQEQRITQLEIDVRQLNEKYHAIDKRIAVLSVKLTTLVAIASFVGGGIAQFALKAIGLS